MALFRLGRFVRPVADARRQAQRVAPKKHRRPGAPRTAGPSGAGRSSDGTNGIVARIGKSDNFFHQNGIRAILSSIVGSSLCLGDAREGEKDGK
jgi:hypothetical protein